MYKIGSIYCIIHLVVLVSCHNKEILYPNCSFEYQSGKLFAIIVDKLNIEPTATSIIKNVNQMDRNCEIMEAFKKEGENYFYFFSNEKINISQYNGHLLNGAIINISFPVYGVSRKIFYIVVQVLSMYKNNLQGCEEYFFEFEKGVEKNKIEYVNHFKSLHNIYVGDQNNLPKLENIDTTVLNRKLKFIDSITSKNLNSIPDSIKLKMGIKIN